MLEGFVPFDFSEGREKTGMSGVCGFFGQRGAKANCDSGMRGILSKRDRILPSKEVRNHVGALE